MIRSSRLQVWIGLGLLSLAPAASAQSGAIDPTFFGTNLYPMLEAAGCRDCVALDGPVSGTRIHWPEKDAATQQIQLFGLSPAPVEAKADPSKSRLLSRPTTRIAQTGGE